MIIPVKYPIETRKFISEAMQTIWTVQPNQGRFYTTNYLVKQYISDLPPLKRSYFDNRNGSLRIPVEVHEKEGVWWVSGDLFKWYPADNPGKLNWNGKPFWQFEFRKTNYYVVKTV